MELKTKHVMNEEYIRYCEENLTRDGIIENAKKNNEHPFGYVLDYIRDNFNVSSTQAWYSAEEVLRHFGLTNKEC